MLDKGNIKWAANEESVNDWSKSSKLKQNASIICFPNSFQETIGSSTLEFLLNENISESFGIMIDCSLSWALQEKPNELKKKKSKSLKSI